MKFRPTEFLNTPYRVSCYIKLYRKLFSVMRPAVIHIMCSTHQVATHNTGSKNIYDNTLCFTQPSPGVLLNHTRLFNLVSKYFHISKRIMNPQVFSQNIQMMDSMTFDYASSFFSTGGRISKNLQSLLRIVNHLHI